MSDRIISDYFLERFVLGELPPDETEEVARAAAADPSVRAALDGLRASDREILACYPAADIMAALIGRRNGADLAEVPSGAGASSRSQLRLGNAGPCSLPPAPSLSSRPC